MISFEFNGIESSIFGLYICSFDGISGGAKNIGDEITINTVKAPKGNRYLCTGGTYENPLTFTFQVGKYDCRYGIGSIESRELARIMRWLIRKDYCYLRFEKDGWDNVFYNCSLKVRKYEIGGNIYGLEIEASCDAPWGYSEPKEHHFQLDGTAPYKLYNYSDEDGELLPDLVKIEILENCDLFKLTNTFYIEMDEKNKKTINTEIKKCKNGEVIQLDRHKNIFSSAVHNGLMDDFNHVFFELFSDFLNTENIITSNAPCRISLYFREIRKGVLV